MSSSVRSVVKLVRHRLEPDDPALRLSQELPSHASGPWIRWATSVIGCNTILAPSQAQPPAAAPGVSDFGQPFLRSRSPFALLVSQAGSLNTAWIFCFSIGRSLAFVIGDHLQLGRHRTSRPPDRSEERRVGKEGRSPWSPS